MRGYGFSVWLLPRNRSKIIETMKKQGIIITHTPHITIKTNFEFVNNKRLNTLKLSHLLEN